jgi:hypothetical protein
MDELLAALKDNRHGPGLADRAGHLPPRAKFFDDLPVGCFRRTRRVLASLGTLLRFILFSVYTIS